MDPPPEQPSHPLSSLPLEGLITHCLQDSGMEEAPRRLGDYELYGELGRGGMGVVYRARHLRLERDAAVKVLPGGVWARPDFAARFRQEAQLAARLQHPHIVTVYETGEEDGTAYYGMELVNGPPLYEGWSATGDWKARAVFMAKVARAIAYAHEQGVLHRDLKPSNILRDAAGEPRVSDFGLACLAERDHTLTLSMDVLGSPAYMPPEQGRGKAGGSSPAADIYSLGGVLYYLLTGRPPFMAGTLSEILHMVRHDQPLPPRRLNTAIPRDLETIALRCLEKEPARRYASAAALAEDLERFTEGRPVSARPVSALTRAWRWCRRRPAIAALSALLITGTAAAVWRIEQAREAAELSAHEARRLGIESREHLRDSLLSEAHVRLLTPGSGSRDHTLELLLRANAIRASDDTQDLAIAAMAQPALRLRAEWPRSAARRQSMALDGAHRLRGFLAEPGRAVLMRVTDGSEEAKLTGLPPEYDNLLCLTDDGSCAVFSASALNRVRVMRWHDGAQLLDTERRACVPASGGALLILGDDELLRRWTPEGGLSAPWPIPNQAVITAVSRDGQLAAHMVREGEVALLDTRTGNQLERITVEQKTRLLLALSIHPDGQHLAITDAQTVSVYHRTQGLAARLENTGAQFGSLDFSPDGRWLAVAGPSLPLRIYDWRNGMREVCSIPRSGTSVRFGNDGTTLALNGEYLTPGALSVLEFMPPRGLHPLLRLGRSDAVHLPGRSAITFDPSGRFLLTADGAGISWHSVADGRRCGQMELAGVRALAHTNDLILAGTERGVIRIPWQVLSGEACAAGRPEEMWTGGSVPLLAASPDSRRVAAASLAGRGYRVRIFETGGSAEPVEAGELPVWPLSLEWSADSAWLAASVDMSPVLFLWRSGASMTPLAGVTRPLRFPGTPSPVPVWSADHRLILADPNGGQYWQPGTEDAPLPLPASVSSGQIVSLALSPDGNCAAESLPDGRVRLTTWPARMPLAELPVSPPGGVHVLQFSPDGSRLGMIHTSGTVYLWDIAESAAATAAAGLRGQLHTKDWKIADPPPELHLWTP